MVLNDNHFKIMQASVDALWIKQRVISNNIANIDTPNFKASQVSFRHVLHKKNQAHHQSLSKIQIDIHKDETISQRLDGNNVDLEKEQLALWETYAHYSYLTQNMSKSIQNLRYVINNTGK